MKDLRGKNFEMLDRLLPSTHQVQLMFFFFFVIISNIYKYIVNGAQLLSMGFLTP